MQSIERCDVAILVIDAVSGITAQDTHIAGFIKDAWKSVILAVNKWDLIEKDSYTAIEFENRIRQELNFLPYVHCVYFSRNWPTRASNFATGDGSSKRAPV